MSIRLRQICLVAKILAPVIGNFKAIFAVDVCFIDPAVAAFGLENSLMPIGSNFLEVVAPVEENTAAGRYLKRRNGDGGYMVICQCDTLETQLARKARAAALDVRIAWEHEGRSFHGMQLHPADTGGAFFEIDWDSMREPEGHWTPAGGSEWISRMHTDVVKYYSAVELQSANPRRLAERWSSIAELPLREDSQGRLEMPLENASVRFVKAADGRGDGLGGIDIAVHDRARVLAAAARRGCQAGEDQLMICGVRFNLR
ncbi:MAG: VOC family protein [Candidatus Binataceae bacterium]